MNKFSNYPNLTKKLIQTVLNIDEPFELNFEVIDSSSIIEIDAASSIRLEYISIDALAFKCKIWATKNKICFLSGVKEAYGFAEGCFGAFQSVNEQDAIFAMTNKIIEMLNPHTLINGTKQFQEPFDTGLSKETLEIISNRMKK